jgi:hypothetical protein
MSGTDTESGQASPKSGSTRIYILVALILIAVIVILAAILIKGRGRKVAATSTVAPTATVGATFTSLPTATQAPAPVQLPASTPSPVMADTDTPVFDFVSAGGRPSTEWTGFFGQVTDAEGKAISGVSLIVWYPDGVAASPVVKTGADGTYEIRLAEEPLVGVWSIQVLTDDLRAASKLQTFRTDLDTQTGIQNIQVLWQKVR